MPMISSMPSLLLLHSNQYYKPRKSNVCFALLRELNGNILQLTRNLFLILEEPKDDFFLAHAGQHYLLIYNDDDEKAAAGHEHPERCPKGYLDLHHRQPKEVQRDSNKVVPDGSKMPEIILLLLLVINHCVLSAKVDPHFINIVNLDEGANGQNGKGDDADPLQLLQYSLAENVAVQTQILLQLPKALILAGVELLAVEQIDEERLLPSLKGELCSRPVIVGHGEDEGKKVKQIEERGEQQPILENIMAFLVLSFDEALLPLSPPPQKSVPVLHQLLY